MLLSTSTSDFTWGMGIFRLVTAIAFIAPGLYCASESNKHRKMEQNNRKLELELASISPFLEKLNDSEKASKILENLAPGYFGNQFTNKDGAPQTPADLKALETAIKPLVELAKLLK